jgi:hypothetical protein
MGWNGLERVIDTPFSALFTLSFRSGIGNGKITAKVLVSLSFLFFEQSRSKVWWIGLDWAVDFKSLSSLST